MSELNKKLFCDLRTDEEKAAFFISGRGYETGVISKALQNDVSMAYRRCIEYKKELYRLVAENERLAKMNQWQPIESAPKDGTEVLLYFPHRHTCIRGFYGEVNDGDWESGYRTWMEWLVDDELFIQEDPSEAPTHWMPLPPAPTETIDEMRGDGQA